jgi:hypothetical protein
MENKEVLFRWQPSNKFPKDDGVYVVRLLPTRSVNNLEFVANAGGWNTSYHHKDIEWLEPLPAFEPRNGYFHSKEQLIELANRIWEAADARYKEELDYYPDGRRSEDYKNPYKETFINSLFEKE